jgi:hypothetical protein
LNCRVFSLAFFEQHREVVAQMSALAKENWHHGNFISPLGAQTSNSFLKRWLHHFQES